MNLGISGNFGQEKHYAEEDSKGWYEPNQIGLWILIWECMSITDPYELTNLIFSLQSLFCINFIKTSYQKLVI